MKKPISKKAIETPAPLLTAEQKRQKTLARALLFNSKINLNSVKIRKHMKKLESQ